jgi:putative ABC transport system permease protein
LLKALRAKGRTAMTVLTVGIMLSAFVFPRALVEAQRSQIDHAQADRVVVQPRRGWGAPLPSRYADQIRQLPGVRSAAGSAFAAFRVPGKEDVFFGSFAVEPEAFVEMHAHQLVTPPEQTQAFLEDEHGVLMSADLARKLGWKLGERHRVESFRSPGEWDLNVVALYEPHHAEWSRNNLWIHYDYLNRSLPDELQNQMAFIAVELRDAEQSSEMAQAIDRKYDAAPARTLTLQDHLQLVALIGRFQAILSALDVASYMILLVVLGILANALAMNVRERTRELGVLRAIGFSPRWLSAMVLGEAAVIGLLGAGVALAIAYPLLQGLVGPALQEGMQFPPLTITPTLALTCLAAGAGLGAISAGWPVYRLVRLGVVESIRRVA